LEEGKLNYGKGAHVTMERRVNVWGKRYTITVYQKSKTVWFAVGEYMDETISVQGRTASTAAKRWAEWARYKGN